MLNLSGKVKISDLLKSDMSLVKVASLMGKMNQAFTVFEIKSMK
jgi:hypothetical protein